MNSAPMSKFDFLIGEWNLEYRIPKSAFAEAGTDSGTGTFTSALNDKYVIFDYSTKSGSAAKGIFAWDEKAKIYRYWWYENSGSFLSATCNFIGDDTLAMTWLETLLMQTFTKESEERVVLKMQYPNEKGGYEPVMEVVMAKK
jgi:hypothetical protein